MQRKDAHLAPLITYLESKTLPDDNNLSRAILQQCDNFFIDEQGLLKHLWTPQGRSRTDTKIQLAVPQSLRYEILKTFHDSPLGGHLGLEKTYDKIRHHYYWSSMFIDIQHWVKSCVDCQMRKTPRNKRNAPLLPIPVEGAFDRVAVDHLGPFPGSYSGNRYVVVFSDYLTRWPEAFAVSTIDAPVIASLLFNEIFVGMARLKLCFLIAERIFYLNCFEKYAKSSILKNLTPVHTILQQTVLLNVSIAIFRSLCLCMSLQITKIGMRFCHQSYSHIQVHLKKLEYHGKVGCLVSYNFQSKKW